MEGIQSPSGLVYVTEVVASLGIKASKITEQNDKSQALFILRSNAMSPGNISKEDRP
jgi:hypothetical protein